MQKARRHCINAAPTACRRTVSGTISLFCSKCFSPFPHGTGSLSVSREYLALPDGPGRFTQNSSCSALLRIPLCFDQLRIPRLSCSMVLSFQKVLLMMSSCDSVVLQPHTCRNMDGLGSSPFARHYWGNHCLFSFPAGTKMFQFPALASNIRWMISSSRYVGLSHSEIFGSKVICTYPKLIAAYHVLHRLREPRHPPCALFYFLSYLIRSHICVPSGYDIYFQLFTTKIYCLLVQYVIDRSSSFLTFPMEWRITDSNR